MSEAAEIMVPAINIRRIIDEELTSGVEPYPLRSTIELFIILLFNALRASAC